MNWRYLRSTILLGAALVGLLTASRAPAADETDWTGLSAPYDSQIRPLVARYCGECHSDDNAEADVNLTSFATWPSVRKDPRTWQRVGEMLDGGQMPPKDADQPTAAERKQLEDWVHRYLALEAKVRAGDPGRVVLRRLSNVEYTYTLRDLTGIESLDPAREFPVDGAAGEGFTNTGNALVMSPALVTKYLDAAKEVGSHLVLLPEGVRFSQYTTRPDWTEETLEKIRAFYRRYTEPMSGDKLVLQGVPVNPNEGGRLPVEKYLAATLAERESLASGAKSIEAVARERGLSPKYLGTLWRSLNAQEPSLLLDGLRAAWRKAKPEDVPALAAQIAAWQQGLWKFGSVGHIGKVGGPKGWLEPASPLTSTQNLKFKVPPPVDGAVTLTLVASDAGDGNKHDFVVWQRPRLVAPGRPDVLLRDVREVSWELVWQRGQLANSAARCLAAAAEAASLQGKFDPAALAKKHTVDEKMLRSWLAYLGIATGDVVNLTGHFKTTFAGTGGFDFIKGWGSDATPQLVANSSDRHVRIPGNMKPHGVAVHPSPTLLAAAGWQSPVTASVRIEATVGHAHPECGNGVTWSLELRRGPTRRRLATGTAQGSKPVTVPPVENLGIQPGDIVSLLIGPRDGNHSCDLTAIDLKIVDQADPKRTWDLAADVSPDVLSGNPHADRLGNAGVWHFYTEPVDQNNANNPAIPAGSLLDKWQAAQEPAARQQLAGEVQKLLAGDLQAAKDSPDAALYQQLTSLNGPLLGRALLGRDGGLPLPIMSDPFGWGADPALFGKHPDGGTVDEASLCVQAPKLVTIRVPADLAAGCELVTTGELDARSGAEGSVQLQIVAGAPQQPAQLTPSTLTVTQGNGLWTGDNRNVAYATPILVAEKSATRRRLEAALEEFRQLFPAALCYTKIVPVDEVVTLTLLYREDDQLARLMLDDTERAYLDRLWSELHFESQDALTLVDAFQQLMEYATQDADPKVFEPMRGPINGRAAAFRQLLVDSQPKQIKAVLDLAPRILRRPLSAAESQELRAFYSQLRDEEIPHDEACRLLLARMLVAPAFLYKVEKPGPGAGQGPISNFELASRLSYFLWSSMPDAELTEVAAAGGLSDTDALLAQTRRMLQSGRTRRLATEFACQWLHIHDFNQLDEKSERHFPTFVDLRDAMYEESIQFFTDLFQTNGSVLGILDADHTFLNEALAAHYGIPGVKGPEWRKVEGVKQHLRGGILGQATTLATQSGASRTSPILRGNWVSETLLGERLPRPPKDVPQLPADEAALEGLTVRQLVEKHTSDAKCAICHQRIDAFGFALESFDAIGRRREKDLGDRPISTAVKTMDGAEFDGIAGLRDYLLTVRREAFVRQFCKKLLGYALGRATQLSDEPLLDEMQSELKAHDYRVNTALELVVRSRQFREIRGRENAFDD